MRRYMDQQADLFLVSLPRYQAAQVRHDLQSYIRMLIILVKYAHGEPHDDYLARTDRRPVASATLFV